MSVKYLDTGWSDDISIHKHSQTKNRSIFDLRMVTCFTGLVVSQDLAVTPAEVRRLAAEEGSLAKKTWLQKKEIQRLGELQ